MEMSMEVIGLDVVLAKLGQIDDNLDMAAKNAVRYASWDLRDDVQDQMPVDTGWAQARWGESQFGGTWELEDGGLAIKQGSGIEPYEYIEKLNEGSSVQAPAGFIDTSARRAEINLTNTLEDEVVNVLE